MILTIIIVASWGFFAFLVTSTMAKGKLPSFLRRPTFKDSHAYQVVMNHVHPPFAVKDYEEQHRCGCSEMDCPACGAEHGLTAVHQRRSIYVRCWTCDYRYKVGPKRKYPSVHRALEAHNDQRALAEYRSGLIEFENYRKMLVKKSRRK